MGRTVASIALGAAVAVLFVLAVTYFDVRLDAAASYQHGDAADPYRMHRTLRESPMMFVVVTSSLVYYFLLGSVLIDRYMTRPSSALAKSLVLSMLAWVVLVGWAVSQGGSFSYVAPRTGIYIVLPLFAGAITMLRVMSSNTSFEQTREG
jgi:hypothetical protein